MSINGAFCLGEISLHRLRPLVLVLLSLSLVLAGCGGRAALTAPATTAATAAAPHTPARAPGAGRAALVLASSGTATGQQLVPGVPVLMYHHLLPYKELAKLPYNSDIVSTERFQTEMQYLASQGYRTLTMAELARVVAGKEPPPAHSVAITFDDGYQSSYIYGYPILKQLHLHATMFLVTGWVSDSPQPFDPQRLSYLAWPEVETMAKDGTFEFQSHTDSLHVLINGQPAVRSTGREAIAADVARSLALIEQHTGSRPIAIAYPYGVYTADMLKAVSQDGLQLGFIADGQTPVHAGDRPLVLRRDFVPGWLATSLFQRIAQGQILWQTPKPLAPARRSARTRMPLLQIQ